MKTIKYQQHEFHHDPVDREAVLSTFVYDVPYLGACGIFPPRRIANQRFIRGGGDGGMGPGASWEPFTLSEVEYQELVAVLKDLDPKTLGQDARFTSIKFEFDPAFDSIPDRISWLKAVCEKYREAYHDKMKRVAEARLPGAQ